MISRTFKVGVRTVRLFNVPPDASETEIESYALKAIAYFEKQKQ